MITPFEASPRSLGTGTNHPASSDQPPPAASFPGQSHSFLQKLVGRVARVEAAETLNAKFRLITLQGNALQGQRWTPGSYLDILVGGLAHPSYTPLDFDSQAGRTRILVYLQAGGPGTRWARTARVGDGCYVHGLRAALDLTKLRRPAVFFGDETTFGLAAALRATAEAAKDVEFFFELNTPAESFQALEVLGLPRSGSSVRAGDDLHLPELEAGTLALARTRRPAHFLLSGRAAAIQRMMKVLKQEGFLRSQFLVQSYWNSRK